MGEIVLLLAEEHRLSLARDMTAEHRLWFELSEVWATDEAAAALDLIVTDCASLLRNERGIAAARQARGAARLPVVLLAERTEMAALPAAVWEIIDDVALRPLDATALNARVAGLLRGRERALRPSAQTLRADAEQDAARRFQTAALPRMLPHVPGLLLTAFYRPGADDARGGGDWYDALALADGRVLFSIGDVCGSGLEAAVAMATVRHVFRGAAQINPDPVVMLDAAHRMLCAENKESLVTAFVGIFDPITSLLTYASAGLPRPFLRSSDGSIVELPSSGAPLGLPFTVERTVNLTSMPLGSLLVLYTDGLTEATRDPIAGEAIVRDAISDELVRAAPNVALAIHDAVTAEGSPDDVAILTVAHVERDRVSERLLHWSFDAREAETARSVRAELVAELRHAGLADAGVANAELVFSELIGNVVRYAARWVDVTLDASGALPVLHILDGGPGFRYLPRLPVDVLSESGRGLFIVAQLTDEFHVTKRPDGGSHARAVLSRTG